MLSILLELVLSRTYSYSYQPTDFTASSVCLHAWVLLWLYVASLYAFTDIGYTIPYMVFVVVCMVAPIQPPPPIRSIMIWTLLTPSLLFPPPILMGPKTHSAVLVQYRQQQTDQCIKGKQEQVIRTNLYWHIFNKEFLPSRIKNLICWAIV